MADRLHLVVAGREDLTPTVTRFVLRSSDGSVLPGYRGGAHITVTTPSGERRSYSLVEPGGRAPSEYVIGVRRDANGRGGSVSMHDDVHVGSVLEVTWPANNFALKRAKRYLFIAGGIGITPIRAMVAEVRARGGADVELLYLTRTPEDTAFLDEFTGSVVHHSAVHGRLDLWPYLAEPDGGDGSDTRIYCCGPTPLIDEVLALTMHWRPSRVHVEDFAGVDALGGRRTEFTTVWAPTGARITVPADSSMLTALRDNGIDVDSSCESGTCGTCRLGLVAGDPDHRDLVLTSQERSRFLMPCVSRSLGEEITVTPA